MFDEVAAEDQVIVLFQGWQFVSAQIEKFYLRPENCPGGQEVMPHRHAQGVVDLLELALVAGKVTHT